VVSSRRQSRLDLRDERGTVVVMFAAAMGALLLLVAIVVDAGGARRDRSADQAATDAMALAGAAALGSSTTPGVAACQAVWSYLVVNLPSTEARPCHCLPARPTPTGYRIALLSPRTR